MGYDYLPMDVGIRFFIKLIICVGDDTALYSRGQRSWVNEESGTNSKQFADIENPAYWPSFEEMGDFALINQVCALLPPGMKIFGRLCRWSVRARQFPRLV